MTNNKKLPFNDDQTWRQKVVSADSIWEQVDKLLKANGKELPTTARRPDVRMILQNVMSDTANF